MVSELAGHSVGEYDVLEKIGQGGMSTVYRAVQRTLSREVALKILNPDALRLDFTSRFAREARLLATLDHPNVLPLFDFGTVDGITYLTTPLMRGGTLRGLMHGQPLTPALAWQHLCVIASALHYAHEAGIVHRDLKPTNILVHRDGRLVLADFGLARTEDASTVTALGCTLGTPGYMAPEQMLGGKIDRRADVYALAVIAFEMFTGVRPYEGKPEEVAVMTLRSQVPSAASLNPELSLELDCVLAKGLAKDPAERTSTAVAFTQELTIALMTSSLVTVPERPQTPPVFRSQAPRTTPVSSGPERQPDMLFTERRPADPAPCPDGPRAAATGSARPWALLEDMGFERLSGNNRYLLEAHFSSALRAAEDVAEDTWDRVLEFAGLSQYRFHHPSPKGGLTIPLRDLACLNEGLNAIFAPEGARALHEWGRITQELEFLRSPNFARWHRLKRWIPWHHQLPGALQIFGEHLDAIRGEHLHVPVKISEVEYWFLCYSNVYVFGRRRPEAYCLALVGQLQALLRRTELANDWTVDEIECGCVSGSSDCVFALRKVGSHANPAVRRLSE